MNQQSYIPPEEAYKILGITPATGGNTNKLTPDQSAVALGHSNSLMSQIMSGAGAAYNAYANTAQNLSVGATQGALSTMQNIGKPVLEGVASLTGNETLKNAAAQSGISNQTLTPQNTTQQVGYTGEKVGEFFLPGGAEKGAVAKGASYIDKIPELIGAAGKTAKAITGTLKTALKSTVSGLSFGGVTAAQTGSLEKGKEAAPLGVFAGGLSGVLDTFGSGMAQSLNKADFRLSPQAEAKTQKVAEKAAKFITNNRIVGSASTKYAKLDHLNSQFEATLQSSLPEGIAVRKDGIIDSIRTSVEQLKSSDPAIYEQARTKASQAVSILNSQPGDIIDVKQALAGKRSWGSEAFKISKKSKQDPTVSSEGAYAVEQAYQKSLLDAFDRSNSEIKIPSQLQKYFGGADGVSMKEFNSVYSDAISAKNLSFMAQFKNDTGLFGRLFGLWAGESVGQAISPGLGGKIFGGATGEILSSHLPGAVRNVGERVLTRPNVPENAAKLYQSSQNNP